MQHPRTDTGSSDLYWGVEEYTVSEPAPLMTGTVLSLSPEIPVSKGNFASYV